MALATRLRLLSRPGCHLCEAMARDLTNLGVLFDLVDIQAEPTLTAAYGDVIPVLMQDNVEIARAPQSARTLKRALERSGVL